MPTRSCGETYNGWVVPDALTVPVGYLTTPERPPHGGSIARSNRNTRCHTDMWTTAEEGNIDTAGHHEDRDIHGMTAGSGNIAGRPQHGRNQDGAILVDGVLDDWMECGGKGLWIKAWRNEWKSRGEDAATLQREDQRIAAGANVHRKADGVACGISKQDSI